jgi:hypothetical protein
VTGEATAPFLWPRLSMAGRFLSLTSTFDDWYLARHSPPTNTSMIRQGTTGILDTASNGQLDGEFGTHKEEEVVKLILEKGDILETEVSSRHSICYSYHLQVKVSSMTATDMTAELCP